MPITPEECETLAAALRMPAVDLAVIIQAQRFERFRIEDLKIFIKFFKEKIFRLHGIVPNWLSLYGRKQDLVNIVRQAYIYQPPPPQSPARTTPTTTRPPVTPVPVARPPSYPYPPQQQQTVRVLTNARPSPSPSPSPHVYRPSTQYQPQQHSRILVLDKQTLEGNQLARQRGPFTVLKKVVEQATLLENTPALLKFDLDQETLENLKRTSKGKYVVVIRVYSSEARSFVPWDTTFQVVANATMVAMPQRLKESKKQSSFRTVKAIDISAFVGQKNSIKIVSRSMLGVAVVEVDRIFNIDQVMQRIEARSKPVYKCSLCRAPNSDLKRCSKCKHAYYCDEKHQLDHWEQHKLQCEAHDTTPPMSPSSIADVAEEQKHSHQEKDIEEDEEIEEVTNSISLICPLMIDRINVPAKGINCKHSNSFDLKMFLQLADQSFNWQCPICLKPLAEPELRVDHRMSAILKLAPEGADEVKLMPDGSVEFPTEEELAKNSKASDAEDEESMQHRREISPLPPPKKQKINEVISIIDDREEHVNMSATQSSQRSWQYLPIPGSREEPIELD
jgi:hypothetical protein